MSEPLPRCLFVTKHVPLPVNGGGQHRTYNILLRLMPYFDVTLAAPHDAQADPAALERMGVAVHTVPTGFRPRDVLEGLLRSGSITSARWWSHTMREEVVADSRRRGFDLIVLEFAQMFPLVEGIDAPMRALVSMNVEAEVLRSYIPNARWYMRPVLRLDAAMVSRQERKVVDGFDVVSVVKPEDAASLPGVPKRLIVSPVGFETVPPVPPAEALEVAFVGQMSYQPNRDAALWIAREVWPRVLSRRPGARLLVVGKNPGPAITALAGPSVVVSGTVDDIAPWYQRARLVLAPLREGGGAHVKILEALSYGRPVVSNTKGVEGLAGLVGEGVVVADHPEEMAERVVELLDSPELASELGDLGRKAVAAGYSYDSSLSELLEALTAGVR